MKRSVAGGGYRDGFYNTNGPDPWDEACSKARRSLQKKLSASEDRRRLSDVVVEYHRTVRGVVVDYVSAVEKLGLVYRVEFVEEGPLHFQIALARYGEQGRRFVVVESVARQCVGRAQIKPTDELVAVNGKVIVEPTSKDRLTELLRTIAAAPWVPVVVAGAGAVALARPEVRAGRALAALGRGVVIGAFPA